MKIMLPATLLVALAACSKKDVNNAPAPESPVWKLTEIAGAGGEPSAWELFETCTFDNKPAMKDTLKNHFLWNWSRSLSPFFGENNIAMHYLADVGNFEGWTKKSEYVCRYPGQCCFTMR